MPLNFPNIPTDDQYYEGWLNQYAGLRFWNYMGKPVGTRPVIPVAPPGPITTTTTTVAPITTTTTLAPTTTTTTAVPDATLSVVLQDLIGYVVNTTTATLQLRGSFTENGVTGSTTRGFHVSQTFVPSPAPIDLATNTAANPFENLTDITIQSGQAYWIWAVVRDTPGNYWFSPGNTASSSNAIAWHGINDTTSPNTSGQFDQANTTTGVNQITASFEVSAALATAGIIQEYGVYWIPTGPGQGTPTKTTFSSLGWTKQTGSKTGNYTNIPAPNRVSIPVSVPPGAGSTPVSYSLRGFVTYTGPLAITTYTDVYQVQVPTGITTTTTTTSAPVAPVELVLDTSKDLRFDNGKLIGTFAGRLLNYTNTTNSRGYEITDSLGGTMNTYFLGAGGGASNNTPYSLNWRVGVGINNGVDVNPGVPLSPASQTVTHKSQVGDLRAGGDWAEFKLFLSDPALPQYNQANSQLKIRIPTQALTLSISQDATNILATYSFTPLPAGLTLQQRGIIYRKGQDFTTIEGFSPIEVFRKVDIQSTNGDSQTIVVEARSPGQVYYIRAWYSILTGPGNTLTQYVMSDSQTFTST